ncbi:LOW QUALITY PROTEIN: papilin-like [Paramacrobiotus metropolitanus]|uniref:LOW QUALITY PROTEIN: papilin-like n=1 Tax=Paramacrobiotus metropolitanus TaxID=2943436 RepID=UPI0024460770|nr:LOW QUALITY PROTEIN: papilin-like [Paramacrobiotus metropolitanus]
MQLRFCLRLLPSCCIFLILHSAAVLCSIRLKKTDEPSAFYLDPVGIESGPWSEWGTRSQCSKLCDGGIAYEQRTCRNKKGAANNECVGPRKRYFMCNTEACPENTPDFRTEQCSKFDDTPYQGQKYKWIPYKKGSNKCELLCRPENGSFYVSFAPQVIDGTACHDDNTAVCVRGKCVSVGCDKRLGSLLQEDKCRMCGGDASSCKFVEGLYDDSDVPESSYAEFLIIPSGSTNIQIRERRPSENYLAMRNVSGEYIFNGDFKVESGKRQMRIAGTLFTYYRESPMYPPAELLTARGPTTEPVAIAMLHQEANPGVLYEFYAPNSAKDVRPLSFAWLARSYGPCSSSCGGGRQSRPVVCVRTSDYEPVDDELCDALVKPQASRQCNVDPCPAFWKVGEWEACSASCGGGTQYRSVVCVQVVGDYTTVVPDAQCKKAGHSKPEVARNCNQFKCPDWMVGEWSPCSAICGPGFQIRTVECKSRNPKDKTEHLSDAACNVLKKPTKTQECLLAPCEGLEWAVSDWTGCNTCGQRSRTRRAVCTSENGTVYPSSMCASAKKPELSDACANAPPCDAMWFSTEWSKCSASCGEGVQTREVFCGTVDNRNASQVVRVATDLCDAGKKLEEKQNCKENFTCDGQWFSGPWMPCTQKCGGGSKRRYIICLKNDSVVDSSSCDKEEKPTDSEDCNTEPCDKEGFLGSTTGAGAAQKDAGVACAETEFGCCPDNSTVAEGPYGAGCNATADGADSTGSKPRQRRLKSVPMFPMDNNGTLDLNGTDTNGTDTTDSLDLDETDMVTTESTPADNDTLTLGEDLAMAPTGRKTKLRSQPMLRTNDTADGAGADGLNATDTDCATSQFGCCSDNTTAASGANQEGCEDAVEGSAAECEGSEFGCCPDGKVPARGPDHAGCKQKSEPAVVQGECAQTEFGCCADGQTMALGAEREGCPESDCANSYHGCCPDGVTFAQGPGYEECPHTKQPKQNCEIYSEQGSCRNYSIKWHYDFEYGDCTRFWYGGCEGNDNRFDSEPECQAECIRPAGAAVCNLPKVHGPCDQNLRMWYYDKYVRECLPFHYGGCLGNENRFESREDCNERCVETAIPDVCQQPMRQGKGPGQIVRWYFDKASGRCNQFFYSGSGGNGNRFVSDDQCLKKCGAGETPRPADICTLEKAEGDCKEYYPRYYFDRNSQRCEQFIYTGCQGNENRFERLEECQQVCLRYLPSPPEGEYPTEAPPTVNPAVQHCFLPSDRGTCERSLPRWHYDSTDGVCKRFLFSGCGGNNNNFETQLHCLNDCGNAQDKCELPKVVGPCRGLLNVYYFDKYERACLPFQYGGCQGNANRFPSAEECQQSCAHVISPPTPPPVDENVHTIPPEYPAQTYPTAPGQNPYLAICSMPVDAGACDERQARYYYDISQGKCLSFTYTGCGGNQNHFHTLEQCEGFCAQFGVGCPARTCDIQCPYGYENDPSSCPTCRCVEPCRDMQCPAYAACTVQTLPNGEFVGTCTSRLEKAGTCPSLEDIPPGSCDRACGTDNECHGQQKCCNNGCGTTCMTPVELGEQPPVYPYPEPTPPPYEPEPPVEGGPYPAFISAGPHELRAEPGQPLDLPCHARGNPEPQVTWQHNNATLRLDDHHFQQRGSDLHIEEVRLDDSGDYICFANNGLGPSAQHLIRLHVESVLKIDGSDTMVSTRVGDRAILKCSAHGVPQPRISWSKGGEPVGRDSPKFRQMGDDSLVIENVQYDDQSVYICTADNGVHAPAIKNVVLRVHEEIKAQIIASSSNFASGSQLRLECRASGYPQPRVRWYLNAHEIISDGDRSQVFTNGTLLIKRARASDAGVYQCQASNEQSSSSDSLRVFITGAPLTQECTDNEYYANCKLIVVAELCNNEYYAKFCCKSCTESGQIRPNGYRRRRKRSLRPAHFL